MCRADGHQGGQHPADRPGAGRAGHLGRAQPVRRLPEQGPGHAQPGRDRPGRPRRARGSSTSATWATDPRVQYPHEAAREGIASMLSVGMQYKGAVVGVLRVYTAEEQAFSPLKIDLLKAVATQAAAAIENARLAHESAEAAALEKQVQMAADVQHRMIPAVPPPGARAGPGGRVRAVLPAGRRLLRLHPVPQRQRRPGRGRRGRQGRPGQPDHGQRPGQPAGPGRQHLLPVRGRPPGEPDALPGHPGSEFVTLFYGVLDARTQLFTYCNAGHPSALVLRPAR